MPDTFPFGDSVSPYAKSTSRWWRGKNVFGLSKNDRCVKISWGARHIRACAHQSGVTDGIKIRKNKLCGPWTDVVRPRTDDIFHGLVQQVSKMSRPRSDQTKSVTDD